MFDAYQYEGDYSGWDVLVHVANSAYDIVGDTQAKNALLANWTTDQDYAQRVDNLAAGLVSAVTNRNVHFL
ncbi:hypothetical protein [Psychrosphaera algicola]|uniref:Uncharacterized protein n=1 Tax=Psychrosphaera algicola TaxID=3023714 RepID=A0ABT5F8Z2_9GAMM|nr:hypothetical protein [Psychrosphaera sp. G1-22]MDC2887599.1 hypothetical protein [Psychrosphaera sp. G1-22]